MNVRSLFPLLVACVLVACGTPPPAVPPTITPAPATAPTNAAAPTPSVTVVPTIAPSATAEPTASPTPSATSTPTAEPTVSPTIANDTTTTPEQARAWSFAYVDPDGHVRMRAEDGTERVVWDQSAMEHVVWSPDGRLLALVGSDQLVMWDAEGGSSRVFAEGVWSGDAPSWSANGGTVAFTRGTDGMTTTLMVADVASGATRELAPGRHPQFAPAGTALVAAEPAQPILGMHEGTWAVPQFWTSTDAAPLRYDEAISLMDWSRVAWNADGSVVAVGNVLIDRTGVVIGEPGTPAVEQVEQGTTVHEVLDGISPDGRQIALASLTITRTEDADAKRTDLTLFDRGTAQRTAIFRGDEEPGHGFFWRTSRVVWSPDGKSIAFIGAGTSDDGTRGAGVWVGDSTGADLRLLPGTSDGEELRVDVLVYPQFSPDGRFLEWEQGVDKPSIWVWEVGTDAPPREVVAGQGAVWRPSR